MERLDLLSGTKGKNGKTYWTKVGTAWPSKTGAGYTVYLDFLPMTRTEDGKMMMILAPPRDKGDAPPQRQAASTDMNDDIPF